MMKGQKGITLVALIITIIVMLILVGVSITVAMNGGLFEKATTAVDETKEKQLDEAVSLVVAEYYADKNDPTTTYTAPAADAFQTALRKYVSDATATAVENTKDGNTWFKVESKDKTKTVYVDITTFATSKTAPELNAGA